MSNFNRDILIQNIRRLMEDTNTTQKQLGEILGMSQPNVNHALNLGPTEKKCFTLEQVVGIANYFNVSVDSLVGNRAAERAKMSPRSIAEFLTQLIERHDISYKAFNKTETVYIPEQIPEFPYVDSREEVQENTYYAFYIPSYWEVPDWSDNEEVQADIQCAHQAGNDTRLKSVNDYLKNLVQIFEVYDNRDLDEEAYRIVVENYLSRLKDK